MPGRGPYEADPYPCIHQLFEAQVERTPDNVAIVWGERKATYAELNRRANSLARELVGRGVGPDSLIALFANRSLDMVAGLLGILKAGAAYVPLDPSYPAERLAFMISDSQAPLLVVPKRDAGYLPPLACDVLTMPEPRAPAPGEPTGNPKSGVSSGNLAYAIYTSGSTGAPKAALLEHRGLTSLMSHTREQMEIGANDRVLQFASFSFDASIWEIFAALVSGAGLVLGDRDSLLPGPNLNRLIRKHGVTIALLSPSVLRLLPSEGLDSLRILVAGTEKLTADLVERWAPGRRFFNAYGPTETTIYSTLLEVREITDRAPSIGAPVPHTEVYILDEELRPVPEGEPGELAIGGIGVARGYLNRDGLTREKFATVAIDGRERRVYRTGDRARLLDDGNIDYLGRQDFQVKVRGFRVEPGEIEALLEQHESVGSAAVVDARDAQEQTVLWAYVVPRAGFHARASDLRSHLTSRLPDYMIPTAFVELERWPLTPNGKLDRGALPPPAARRDDPAESDTSSEDLSPTQATLVALVGEILGDRKLRLQDDFGSLGFHSLAIAQLVARIESTFSVRVSYSEAFTAPSLAWLAARIDEKTPSAPQERPAPERRIDEDIPLSFAQERVWFVERLHPGCRAYEFQSLFTFEGKLDVTALERSLNEIVSRHEILRTSFPTKEGRPVQRIHPFEEFELPVETVESAPEEERQLRAMERVAAELRRPFDVTRLPLVRWKLFRIEEGHHLLLHHEHHFVHDGWSYGVFLEELGACYRAFSRGVSPELPPPSLQYREFAIRQRERLAREDYHHQLDYWVRRLENAPPPPSLPSDRPRPPKPTFRGAQLRGTIDGNTYARLLAACAREDVTPYIWLLTVFQTFLHAYTGATDMCVGTGFANRSSLDSEKMLGMVLNTVAARGDFSGEPSFREALHRLRRVILEAADNQDVPFQRVIQELNPDRPVDRPLLFNTFFDSYDRPFPELAAEGLEVQAQHGISNGSAKFDLVVLVIPRESGGRSRLQGAIDSAILLWEYNTDLFDAPTAEKMLRDFTRLLQMSLESPATPISRLRMKSAEEGSEAPGPGSKEVAQHRRS